MNNFLPEGYKEPVESNYMKFELGENPFRILGSAVIGWEYWTEETVDGVTKNKPKRVKEEGAIPVDEVVEDKYGNLNINFFWAFPVYNFNAEKIQILEVTQKTVRKQMEGYVKNAKWGDPKQYNFVVTREKNGDKTEYSVIAEPKEALDPAILAKYKAMNLDMQVWMAGDDPFKKNKTLEGSTESVDPDEIDAGIQASKKARFA